MTANSLLDDLEATLHHVAVLEKQNANWETHKLALARCDFLNVELKNIQSRLRSVHIATHILSEAFKDARGISLWRSTTVLMRQKSLGAFRSPGKSINSGGVDFLAMVAFVGWIDGVIAGHLEIATTIMLEDLENSKQTKRSSKWLQETHYTKSQLALALERFADQTDFVIPRSLRLLTIQMEKNFTKRGLTKNTK